MKILHRLALEESPEAQDVGGPDLEELLHDPRLDPPVHVVEEEVEAILCAVSRVLQQVKCKR